MTGAVQRAKDLAGSASSSLKKAADWTTETVKGHMPTPTQLRELADRSVDAARSAGDMVKELVHEIVESKPFRDAAKGGLVGAAVAVPLPLVGPVFGAAVGAVAAVYFGQRGATGSATVVMPAEGSEPYLLLRELDDLRRRKVLTKEQFDEQVRKILDAWTAATPTATTTLVSRPTTRPRKAAKTPVPKPVRRPVRQPVGKSSAG